VPGQVGLGQLGARRRRACDEAILEQDVRERRRVRDVDHRRAIDRQAIGGRDVRMVEARARHRDVRDLELRRVEQLAKGDAGLSLVEGDRKVGIVGLRSEDRAQVQVVALARVDMQAAAGLIKR
jgi:hypothetical protein